MHPNVTDFGPLILRSSNQKPGQVFLLSGPAKANAHCAGFRGGARQVMHRYDLL
jgi:hypothetical protein